MAYTPREIKDRVAVGDDIFIVEDLGDNRIRLIPAPTHVSEPGTPVNKALLQPIEDFLATLDTSSLIPRGAIVMWSGAVDAIPEGWALCDGSNGTPDLRDRFIVGAGGSYNVGDTGGANTVTLTADQMPRHRHQAGTLATTAAGLHKHGYREPGGLIYPANPTGGSTPALKMTELWYTEEAGDHNHTIFGWTSYTGDGKAHENRPPYYALCFIMKL